MGEQVIPIPIEVVSHFLPFLFSIPFYVLFPFPWNSHSHWESLHAHLYIEAKGMGEVPSWLLQGFAQNPLHQFPRSKSVTSWRLPLANLGNNKKQYKERRFV